MVIPLKRRNGPDESQSTRGQSAQAVGRLSDEERVLAGQERERE
jgi:hypothetical protein